MFTRDFVRLYSKAYLVLLFYFVVICATSYIGASMKGYKGFDDGIVIGLAISATLWVTVGRNYSFGSRASY